MRIILGIGNPDPTYALTRHNAGWLVLDVMADAREVRWRQARGPYLEAAVAYDESACVLIKPLTYVNRTGEAAVDACERYGVSASELLVVVDDVHLPLSQLRLRQRGSSGGHNGLISLAEALGTDEMPRLRFGIGAPAEVGGLVDHVLSPFTPDELPVAERAARSAAAIAEAFGRGGYAAAATAYCRHRAAARSA